MKSVIFLLLTLLIFSCSQRKTQISPLEGTWERIGTILYENGKPADTVPIDDNSFQVKIFGSTHTLWLGNSVFLDSTGIDINLGSGGYSRNYSVKNGILTEFISMGTDGIENWFKSSYSIDENGNYPVSFKVNLSNNYYSQLWELDSLGNGNAEFYKRVE